ncbi:MAG: hypothetical protein ACLFUL_12505 [Desulfobacteraceae bacterium]
MVQRIGQDTETVAAILERTAEKGLVFRIRGKESTKYGAAPFVVGIYEYQVGRMDRELAQKRGKSLIPLAFTAPA